MYVFLVPNAFNFPLKKAKYFLEYSDSRISLASVFKYFVSNFLIGICYHLLGNLTAAN